MRLKRYYILFIISILLVGLLGCDKKETFFNIDSADEITIMYGVSSYAYFGDDKDTIKKVIDSLNSLSFKESDKEMNITTMFSIDLAKDGSQVAHLCMDDNGVFWVDGKTDSLEIDSGTLDYEVIKDIYKNGK
ncbi:MAG TPA: hypothetical protein VHP81_10605 [Lachnospiraceae bacterium]|nr:hypothetical protein [Lachnospiraceae bacterium]